MNVITPTKTLDPRLQRTLHLMAALVLLLGCTGTTGVTSAPRSDAGQTPATTPDSSFTTSTTDTWITDPIHSVQLYTRLLQPDPSLYAGQHFPTVIVVPGGLGDGAPMIDRPEYQQLARDGFVVVGFNAPGRGNGAPGNLRSEGVEDCNGFAGQDALKAVIEAVAALPNVDVTNIGVQTGSYGIVMGGGALGRYPGLPIRYLVDMEGPSNNLIHTFHYSGQERDHLCGHWSTVTDPSPENAAWWEEREPYRYIGGFDGSYLRAQAERDHAQPAGVYTHTLEMNNAAVTGGVPWVRVNGSEIGNPINVVYTDTMPIWVEGRLSDHPTLTTDYIREMAGFAQEVPPVYISIVMHNEEPHPGGYPDFVNDEPAFWQQRNALVGFADMLHDQGVMFNYQSDWNFLMAAGLYDSGTVETNGKNIVRYLKEDLGFEVDPHAHETRYNYADVAYLISQLGVTPSAVAGGMIASPPQDSKLEYLWQPLTSTLEPSFNWQAEILWGGATSNHVDEEHLWISGIWKPQDKTHFLVHDEQAPVPHVGGYGGNCMELLAKQQAGVLASHKLHTCSIFVGQSWTQRPGHSTEFAQTIADLEAAGEVRWVGLSEAVDIWMTEYGSQPNILPYLAPSDPAADESPFGFHPARVSKPGYHRNGFEDANDIGVTWSREGVYAFWFLIQPDLGVPVYDFTLHDRQWGEVPASMRILGNIAPQTDRIDEGRCLPGSWLPVDEQQYTDFVEATVERYDGDGIDDMPGLTNPITYWQVSNEPNLLAGRADFADLQRITYTAIKDACSNCTVLIGGVAGFPNDYVANFDAAYAPILTELAGQYVDVFDFHWYGKADGDYRLRDSVTGEDVLDHVRATLTAAGFPSDMPIWITEMGSYSGDPADPPTDPFPLQTERDQAGDYFKRYIYSLARGVDKVFAAFGLMEGFKQNDGYFDHTGLIYDGEGSGDLGPEDPGPEDPGLGVRKLSYYTYKLMTETLEGADWATLTTLHDGTGTDHLYLFRVEKDGRPIYIAWWDWYAEPAYEPGDRREIELRDLQTRSVSVTEVVPHFRTGEEVRDFASAFTRHLVPTVSGSVLVRVGRDPVFIEGAVRGPATFKVDLPLVSS